ncbi:Uncharacterised protein [Candidatus Gugararchaeum adminiculabundum]|nr:Uncharacterised protein [Candidatus Gugararchaeum adminiculabundum]
MKFLLLDMVGVLIALVIGAIILFFSGPFGPNFLILLIVFLAAGVIVTKYEKPVKKEMGIYEHERSWENVVANGLVPVLCAVLATIDLKWGAAYIGAVAAITSDKFASELGVLGGNPLNLMTLKLTRPGTSGSMSALGTFMSFDGALLIGFAARFLFPQLSLLNVLAIGLIGFAGSFVDTLFGILEEKGIGNKSTTNIICAIAGAVLGYYLLPIVTV